METKGWYKSIMVKVSAVLPLYKGIKYIEESIESIISQTYGEWELIVVSEYGNDDGSAEVVELYARKDDRIRLIQNKERLGLAESLNIGIQAAKGDYIARVDVDDTSYPERFFKQVQYMDEHSDVFLCGTLQRSVLPDRSYIQEAPTDAEELKAALLFGCEISHCSVMFRRSTFLQCGMYYDAGKLGEDYDLWTRIMFQVRLVNLPEVLVDHRWGFENISLAKGEKLKQEVCEISARTLGQFGIKVADEDLKLLCGWRNRPEKYAQGNIAGFLQKAYLLLEEIQQKNDELCFIEHEALDRILWKRWNWVCKTCGLFFYDISYDEMIHAECEPVVSVILPVYEAVHTLRETIDSILKQDYDSWELIIVCEYGNNDGSIELAKYYSKLDKRIKVIENDAPLGLAGSLNVGILRAKGQYIARLDADDLSNARRLSTQVSYMDKKRNVGITQFYQHYFGQSSNSFIHCPPLSAEAMKAKLLFFCDACHSTIMIRKSILQKYQLIYRENAELEDYDLWIRMVKVTSFETIPEVYGEYRVSDHNITLQKHDKIQAEMCQMIAEQLEENLGVSVEEKDRFVLGGWKNVFLDLSADERDDALGILRRILLEIWNANRRVKYYSSKELLMSIAAKWRWAKYNEPWQGEKKATDIRRVLELSARKSWRDGMFNAVIKKPLAFCQRIMLHFDGKSIEHLSNVIHDTAEYNIAEINRKIEHWTWERYRRIEKRLDMLQSQNVLLRDELTELLHRQNLIPYVDGEQIRIVFLFQIASFWPSWESFFTACQRDMRIDARLVFLNETNTEKSQMLTAQSFLEQNALEYVLYEEFPMEEFRPHVLVMQTPYDGWHRKEEHWSSAFKAKGYRIVYVPYGIEISDTQDSRKLHFDENVIRSCWRIYTYSECMKKDYWKYCSNRKAVVALGLPKFDSYYNKGHGFLPEQVEKRRNGRPCVLWKVHFPKVIYENGVRHTVTPSLDEYFQFAKKLREFSQLFFVFMPHPKFREMNNEPNMKYKSRKIFEYISESENAWIDENDDYRNSLLSADYIIVDRSALMVEAGALNVPVLYMSNADYVEPVTKAIEPLMDSYYQGKSYHDMIQFLNMCMEGRDMRRTAREKAFELCIPDFDGNAGERIKEDIVQGVISKKT